MKDQLEFINTSWEKIAPKDNKYNFWSFLIVTVALLFAIIYFLLFTLQGWFAILLTTLVCKLLLQ